MELRLMNQTLPESPCMSATNALSLDWRVRIALRFLRVTGCSLWAAFLASSIKAVTPGWSETAGSDLLKPLEVAPELLNELDKGRGCQGSVQRKLHLLPVGPDGLTLRSRS